MRRAIDKTPIEFDINGDSIAEEKTSESGQTYIVYRCAYRHLRVTVQDGKIINDGSDTETVTIDVVSGLDVLHGDTPTVLDCDDGVTMSVDSSETTKILTNGSVSFDLTTDKSPASEIEIVAEGLTDHPAESDSATIEVVSA